MNYFLFGITLCQVIAYAPSFLEDFWFIKTVVVVVPLTDWASVINFRLGSTYSYLDLGIDHIYAVFGNMASQ